MNNWHLASPAVLPCALPLPAGAYFGTTFAHLFQLTYPQLRPAKPTGEGAGWAHLGREGGSVEGQLPWVLCGPLRPAHFQPCKPMPFAHHYPCAVHPLQTTMCPRCLGSRSTHPPLSSSLAVPSAAAAAQRRQPQRVATAAGGQTARRTSSSRQQSNSNSSSSSSSSQTAATPRAEADMHSHASRASLPFSLPVTSQCPRSLRPHFACAAPSPPAALLPTITRQLLVQSVSQLFSTPLFNTSLHPVPRNVQQPPSQLACFQLLAITAPGLLARVALLSCSRLPHSFPHVFPIPLAAGCCLPCSLDGLRTCMQAKGT